MPILTRACVSSAFLLVPTIVCLNLDEVLAYIALVLLCVLLSAEVAAVRDVDPCMARQCVYSVITEKVRRCARSKEGRVMPQSLFKQQATTVLSPARIALDECKEDIIASLSTYRTHGPVHASTCYIWPSSECPVGCGHCNYASPTSLTRLTRYSVAGDPAPVMRLMNGMGLWKAVLSGGGEPMVEPDFCELFVHEIDSPALEEIELITSAHFAEDDDETRRRVHSLVNSWRTRPAQLAKASFTIRISLDWFHAQRIGVEPAARVIRILGEDDARDVGCYIRSVLLDDDTTISKLAASLGGRLTALRDYQQEILLPDGRAILVYFKNLIVDGRMNGRKLARLPVSLPAQSRAEVFGRRFEDDRGKHVPARTYNGPTVRHLDGLACLIDDDGRVRILEGNDPHRCPNVSQTDDWGQAISYLYADPVTIYLVDNGPQELSVLLSDAFPEAVRLAADTNQLYHLTELLLSTPESRLYATLRALEIHLAEQRVNSTNPKLIDRAWAMLAEQGVSVARPGPT